MFSFAMTSGLASDSDKFKITTTLRRAQKFGDTGPYKNFHFLFNLFVPEFFSKFRHLFHETAQFVVLWSAKSLKNVAGFGRRMLRLPLALSSLVGAIGRAGLRMEVGLLKPEPRGPKVLRHQMVRWSAGGTEYPRWWPRQVGRQQFCCFFNFDKYAMFSFAMTSGLASVSDEFKITITLRRAQKFGDTGPYKNFHCLFNPLVPDFFCNPR